MTDADALATPPRRLLLATDLSSDCDRALDRSAQLAIQWDVPLHVVHALAPEPRSGAWWSPGGGRVQPEQEHVGQVERQIRRDLVQVPPRLAVHVEVGGPVEVIQRVAEREDCDLVVAGTSGPTFASIIMHTTTEHLLRRLRRSLLVVKARPRGAYRRILVGTDFTAESRHGLETAAAWFTPAEFTLMHALDIPYRSMFLEAGREDEFARLEHDTMASFVAAARLPAGFAERLDTRVVYGHPEAMLSEQVRTGEADLTVVGALRRGLAFHMLVGGNAARIVQTAPGDVLVVHSAAGEK